MTSDKKKEKKIKRIESSAEITSLLKYFMEFLGADAAILYKYIDTDDLEAYELLELLARSPLNQTLGDVKSGGKTIKELIACFVQGTELDSSSLIELKNNIRVLRFCDFVEKEGSQSRWNFDYANRPRKYLVVKDGLIDEQKEQSTPDYLISETDKKAFAYQIPDEGVTSLFCRCEGNTDKYIGIETFQESMLEINGKKGNSCVPHLVLSREDLNKQRSHTKTTKEDGVFDNFHSHHAAFVLLKNSFPEDGNGAIGCLRFEFYDKGDFFQTKKSTIKKSLLSIADENIINMVVGVVRNVLINLKDKSYENQYHCLIPILDQVRNVGVSLRRDKYKLLQEIKIKDEDDFKKLQRDLLRLGPTAVAEACKKKFKIDLLEKLFNALKLLELQGLIEHLFYVLKRNTYYGEAILERINRFVIDLLKTLDLPQEIFSDIWDSLKKHEDLMLYDIDNYRDHFMHQFHVFIVGYLFICSYGLKHFKKLMQNSYEKAMEQASLLRQSDKKGNNYFFSDIDVVRIWTLASLFHDCGYAFEKLSDGFDSFSERVLGAKLETEFKLDKVFFEHASMIGSIETMTCYFASCDKISNNFDRVKLFRILTDSLLRKFDHGIISALILLEKFKEKSEVNNIEDIKYIAALSIAIHNQQVFGKLYEICNQSICLQSNPIIYLLGYCDTIQEWGRRKTTKDNLKQATPRLSSLIFPSSAPSSAPSSYEVKLKYLASAEGNKPDIEKIKKILSQKKCVFITSREQLFSVKYDIRSCLVEDLTFDFMPCGHICEDVDSNSSQNKRSKIIEHPIRTKARKIST